MTRIDDLDNFIFAEPALRRTIHEDLEKGLCAQGAFPASLWDAPSVGERRRNVAKRIAQAMEICDACPVKDLCREWGEAQPDASGVWGGKLHQNSYRYEQTSKVELRRRQQELARKITRAATRRQRAVRSEGLATDPTTRKSS